MQFKTDRVAKEYETLLQKNPKLWRLLSLTDQFSKLEFGKEIVLTMVFRTAAEQIELYKDTPADQRPAVSPHQLNLATDLRSSIYNEREIERLLGFLNTFTYQGGQRKVAIYHAIAGNVEHFHIQYGEALT